MSHPAKAQIQQNRSILRLIVVFVLLSLAPLAALSFSSVRLTSDALTTEVEDRLDSAAELSATAVQGELEGVAHLVESYAERPSLLEALAVARPQRSALSFQLEELRQARPGIAVAFLARPDGRLLDVSPATKSIIGKDFSFRDWYKGVTATGGTYVSEAFIGQVDGRPTVVAVATIVSDAGGRQLGILAAAYELGALRSFVNRFSATQNVTLTLTDQRGTLLAELGTAAVELVSRRGDPLVAAALQGGSGVASRERAGTSQLVAYRPIANLGWTVTASVPEKEALAALARLRSSVYGAAGLLALVLLGGLALLIRSLLARRRAEESAERARAETERLHAESARLAAVVEGSDDAILSMTREGVIASWNGGAERLYGYTRADAIGQPVAMLVPPERAGEEWELLGPVLAGTGVHNRVTQRRRRDGTLVDVALTMSPTRDAEGGVTGASTIARDITERLQAEQDARRARAEAERANHAKSEFLSRMSHELRTPMNAVLGFAQLLELGELDDEQRESIDQILRAGNHLLGLINEVLDVARIEAGKLSLSLESVDPEDALAEAVDLIKPLAAARGITMTVEEEGADACEHADRQRLKQVLLNLLSNAVKYNREDGRVVVRLEQKPDERFRIAVSDTGPGISPQQQERLFSPFERLDADAGSGSVEGTGLGLTLSKGLAEAMGGRLGVDSRVGEGSTFWIDLDAAESGNGDAQLVEERLENQSTSDERGPAGAVLYIEDNLSNLRLIEHVLGRFPHIELVVAMQGTLGIDLAREHRPDLILLDLHLPDLDGEEVLARLRAERETASIPVVVLSADVTPSRIERLRASGVDDYLPKPLDVARFIELLHVHLPEHQVATMHGGHSR